jgi:hypothetical protein
MPSTAPDYDEISARLDDAWDEQDSPAFRAALRDLSQLAERGDRAAAESLAEILALPGPHRAPDAAYKWYFIALSQQGYATAFQDKNGTPPAYRGPVGDFRNEAVVSELVSELGFARVAELDLEATAWLRARSLAAGGKPASGPLP